MEHELAARRSMIPQQSPALAAGIFHRQAVMKCPVAIWNACFVDNSAPLTRQARLRRDDDRHYCFFRTGRSDGIADAMQLMHVDSLHIFEQAKYGVIMGLCRHGSPYLLMA